MSYISLLETDIINLEAENEELKRRISKTTKMVHNIREYSLVYTPIAEGCQDVLRVLKGRDIKIKKYTSNDWYNIAGRGDVAVVRCDLEDRPNVGDTVKIDGKEYEISGLETMGYAKPIGILVKGSK